MIQSNSLSQVIFDALEARIAEIHVSMPGVIQKYDSSTGLAYVQPSLQRKFQDGTIVSLPVIANVPVAFPRANSAFVHLPIKAGDSVILLFSERSLDNWISNGGIVDPADPRKHQLSDAIAIPGGYPLSTPATVPNATDLVLANGTAIAQLQSGGKFLFKGAGGQEVMDLIDQLLTALIQATTQDPLTGPTPFTTTTIQKITDIQTKWEAMKGS